MEYKTCEKNEINIKRKNEIDEMDFKTLNLLYESLDNKLNKIKEKYPKSKSIVGMEITLQLIFDIIADKNITTS